MIQRVTYYSIRSGSMFSRFHYCEECQKNYSPPISTDPNLKPVIDQITRKEARGKQCSHCHNHIYVQLKAE